MFFRPEIVDSKWESSLVQMLDETIQMCPIDCRRTLYKNIILSGGSTTIKNLVPRLDREVKNVVQNRLNNYASKTNSKPSPIEINMYGSPYKNYAVWNGGSMLACHVSDSLDRTTSQTTTIREKNTGKWALQSRDTTPCSLLEEKAHPRRGNSGSSPRMGFLT